MFVRLPALAANDKDDADDDADGVSDKSSAPSIRNDSSSTFRLPWWPNTASQAEKANSSQPESAESSLKLPVRDRPPPSELDVVVDCRLPTAAESDSSGAAAAAITMAGSIWLGSSGGDELRHAGRGCACLRWPPMTPTFLRRCASAASD